MSRRSRCTGDRTGGQAIPANHRRFAHRLIDGGVDVVHGHSSHHPRRIEVYHGKLILYGCGDCVDDYEGIGGHEEFRGDLRLLYFPSVAPDTGRLLALRMVPLRARQLRLSRASPEDTNLLRTMLNGVSHRYAPAVDIADGMLQLRLD